jgi:hypothetical protein
LLEERDAQPHLFLAFELAGVKGILGFFHRVSVHAHAVVFNDEPQAILLSVGDHAHLDVSGLRSHGVFDDIQKVQGDVLHGGPLDVTFEDLDDLVFGLDAAKGVFPDHKHRGQRTSAHASYSANGETAVGSGLTHLGAQVSVIICTSLGAPFT